MLALTRQEGGGGSALGLALNLAFCIFLWVLVFKPAFAYRCFGRLDPRYRAVVSGEASRGSGISRLLPKLVLFAAALTTLELALVVLAKF